MANSKEIVASANIAVTNILIDFENNNSNLKINDCLSVIYNNLSYLEQKKNKRVFAKLKDAMFEDEEDRLVASKQKLVVDATEQLKACNKCKCKTCIINEPSCKCSGCILGAYVSKCDGGMGIETRSVMHDTIFLDGKEVVKLEHNRSNGKDILITVNSNGLQSKYNYEFSTGKYNLI